MYLHLSPTYIVNPNISHLVLRVTLKGGKTYAVDLSGAQFGFREPVLPREEFASQRIQHLEATHPFGHAKTLTDNVLAKSTADHIANFWNNKIVSQELKKVLDAWLETEETKLATVMKLGSKAYEQQSSKLLEA